MSFPTSAGGIGGGGSGSSNKAIALRLSAPAVMNVGEIAKVPFDSVLFNDGFDYSSVTQEITISKAGTLVITGTVGCAVEDDNTPYALTCFVFKNGVPIRQHASQSGGAPYTSAAVSIVDKCVVGDKYEFYSTRTAKVTYSLVANQGITGFEIGYL